jgi:hypothetical protein
LKLLLFKEFKFKEIINFCELLFFYQLYNLNNKQINIPSAAYFGANLQVETKKNFRIWITLEQ